MSRRKPKLLSQHDIKEVVRFQQYLHDLRGDMPSDEFAEKYHEYMGTTAEVAKVHVERERTKVQR